MNETTYLRQIYDWLTKSELAGSTTTIVSQFNLAFQRLDNILTKIDSILGVSSNILIAVVFFVFLWFAMQFVQKRWYST